VSSFATVTGVRFDDGFIWLTFSEGPDLKAPIAKYPKLMAATAEQRDKVRIKDDKLFWDELDQEISTTKLIVRQMEKSRRLVDLLKPFRQLHDEDLCQGFYESAYGGSMYLSRKDTDGKDRHVVSVNVSGKRLGCPEGQADVWISGQTLSLVLGIPELDAISLIKTIPETAKEMSGDYIFRIETPASAQSIVDALRQWFGEYPG
jgi:hypothetical protein